MLVKQWEEMRAMQREETMAMQSLLWEERWAPLLLVRFLLVLVQSPQLRSAMLALQSAMSVVRTKQILQERKAKRKPTMEAKQKKKLQWSVRPGAIEAVVVGAWGCVATWQ